MAGVSTEYICQQCGARYAKWQGRCDQCGSWNSLAESLVTKKEKKSRSGSGLQVAEHQELSLLSSVKTDNLPRLSSGFEELDRVLGGGIVPGSAVLIGGEPGVGKSTLLLQVILTTGGLYISAEESAHQIKLRADRMKATLDDSVKLLTTNNVDKAIAAIEQEGASLPLVIVDSIQTMATDDLEGVPGSVGQVRESAHRLVNTAKKTGVPLLIVGHVTKEGSLAGPKVLEHVVDAVLYVEGEEMSLTRLVRGTKNRFGAVHEVGLFELTETGMQELLDPAQAFVGQGPPASGSVVTVSMEGIRPMLLEIQALASKTHFGLPRRTANGMDYNRLLMLIAVLAKRTKVRLDDQDIYTNIAGGMKVKETALDLAVCLAVVSSAIDVPLAAGTVVFGEVSLSGEIKPVVGQKKRTEQAKKLGYERVISSDVVKRLPEALKMAFPNKF